MYVWRVTVTENLIVLSRNFCSSTEILPIFHTQIYVKSDSTIKKLGQVHDRRNDHVTSFGVQVAGQGSATGTDWPLGFDHDYEAVIGITDSGQLCWSSTLRSMRQTTLRLGQPKRRYGVVSNSKATSECNSKFYLLVVKVTTDELLTGVWRVR